MKVEVKFYIEQGKKLSPVESRMLSAAHTYDEMVALVKAGILEMRSQTAEEVFTNEIKDLSRWEKIKILIKLIFRNKHQSNI